MKAQKFQCDLCHEYFKALHKISLSTKDFHKEHNLCNSCFENIRNQIKGIHYEAKTLY